MHDEQAKNNRKRLLSLIHILMRYSDEDHHISMPEIIELLENEYHLSGINRKTIYEDIKTLDKCNFNITRDDGYFLVECPFSLSEIKTILDALSDLKNLDSKVLNEVEDKLYSFISVYDEAFLRSYRQEKISNDHHFFYKIENILFALKKKTTLTHMAKYGIKEIIPLYLHRDNDYYYLYYEFVDYHKKFYHSRLDHLHNLSLTNHKKEAYFSKDDVLKQIQASTNAYYSGEVRSVEISLQADQNRNKERILEEFPESIVKKNDRIVIKTSVNEAFFGFLSSFKNQIKIEKPADIILQYREFLKTILNQYDA